MSFASRVLNWYDRYGRKDLPWQQPRSLYRVWISEVMLQQTQVNTVIPYYQRFLTRFPSPCSLAGAGEDEVLHYWSGLGYYARARNLHRAAGIICDRYNGHFPGDFEAVLALPGIGRSTAGAILAQALEQRHPILDGNVKRLLSRYHGIDGWPGQPSVEKQLWHWAERHTPHQRLADYTQAIMDLGATLCTRGKPKCDTCPLNNNCEAFAQDRVSELPTPKPRKPLPVKKIHMLLLINQQGEVLLEKRPPVGIWGGLWSLPEASLEDDIEQHCRERWGFIVSKESEGPILRHSFSHYHLDITPCRLRVENPGARVMEAERLVWYNLKNPDRLGMAAPVKYLINDR